MLLGNNGVDFAEWQKNQCMNHTLEFDIRRYVMWFGQTDLTPQHKDSVDVRQDAMETEVYVRPNQREH